MSITMPIKPCQDESGNPFSPVVYEESLFRADGTKMNNLVTQNEIAEAYDPTKTYPTQSQYCIEDNKFYVYSGASGTTTTGAFDSTKWTETSAAAIFSAINSSLMQTNSALSEVSNRAWAHYTFNATISNNGLTATFDFSGIRIHGLIFIMYRNNIGGRYNRLFLTSWANALIKDLSQNVSGDYAESGHPESGDYSVTFTMPSNKPIGSYTANVYYIGN